MSALCTRNREFESISLRQPVLDYAESPSTSSEIAPTVRVPDLVARLTVLGAMHRPRLSHSGNYTRQIQRQSWQAAAATRAVPATR